MNPHRVRRKSVKMALFLRSAILLAVTAVALSIGTARLASAALLSVNSRVDAADENPGENGCRTSAGECTLRAAIMEANALSGQDTIIVPAGIYLLTIVGAGEDQGATGDLDIITSDLTIRGAGTDMTIIQGGPDFNDRLMHVLSTTVEIRVNIRGVTLQNGTVVGNGGGLRNQKGTVTLRDCSVVGNRATTGGKSEDELRAAEEETLDPIMITSGGGIFNTGTLRLIRCSVDQNIAAAFGGGIASDTIEARVILNNFTVSNNKTGRGSGGGIFINRAALDATNGRIVKNRAGDPSSPEFFAPSVDAGGIGTDKRTSRASLMNVTLSENSALEDGGAIEHERGTMELTNCVVSDNWTEGREVGGVLDGQGGSIENDRGTMTIRNSRIVNNTSATRAGAIHNANGRLEVIESTISGNWAKAHGGGIYNRENPYVDVETGCRSLSTPSLLTIDRSTVSDNTAELAGGGIVNAPCATAMIINSTIAKNFIFSVPIVTSRGSALENFGMMTVSHSTVTLNGPGGRGGGAIFNFDPTPRPGPTGCPMPEPPDCDRPAELTIGSTILAENAQTNCARFNKLLNSLGFNLFDDSVSLRPRVTTSVFRDLCSVSQPGDQKNVPAGLDPSGLQNNGGPTLTHALLSDSRAIDAGTNSSCTPTDQRGFVRPVDGNGDGDAVCDIGAFEFGAMP